MTREVSLTARNPLTTEEGQRLLQELAALDEDVHVRIDLRYVQRWEAHTIATLAKALQSRRAAGSFIGLSWNNERMLEYLGIVL